MLKTSVQLPFKRLYPLALSLIAAAQTAPIPDVATLLKDVQDHQHQTDSIRENYTFHETIRTDVLDSKDAVKESHSEESEVFFYKGHRIIRLLKRDGADLSPNDQKKEDERVKKEIENYHRPPIMKREEGGGQTHIISRILAVSKTSNPRRTTFRNRPTIVIDFEGDPHAKASGMDESAAKKLAGTVWIDESDRQVARLEVHFYDSFHIGGGILASVQKGTAINVDQAPIGDGLWMQTGSEDHLAARIVIKNLRENVHIEDFGFKKFDVGTAQQIGVPAGVPRKP